jgi:hypothetical protein
VMKCLLCLLFFIPLHRNMLLCEILPLTHQQAEGVGARDAQRPCANARILS